MPHPFSDTLTKSASDLFQIAVNMAGFDAQSLLLTIYRLQKGRDARANALTVEKAMGILSRGHPVLREWGSK